MELHYSDFQNLCKHNQNYFHGQTPHWHTTAICLFCFAVWVNWIMNCLILAVLLIPATANKLSTVLTNPLTPSQAPLLQVTKDDSLFKHLNTCNCLELNKRLWTVRCLDNGAISATLPPTTLTSLRKEELYAQTLITVGVSRFCGAIWSGYWSVKENPQGNKEVISSPACQSLQQEHDKHMARWRLLGRAAGDRCVDWWWQRWLTITVQTPVSPYWSNSLTTRPLKCDSDSTWRGPPHRKSRKETGRQNDS